MARSARHIVDLSDEFIGAPGFDVPINYEEYYHYGNNFLDKLLRKGLITDDVSYALLFSYKMRRKIYKCAMEKNYDKMADWLNKYFSKWWECAPTTEKWFISIYTILSVKNQINTQIGQICDKLAEKIVANLHDDVKNRDYSAIIDSVDDLVVDLIIAEHSHWVALLENQIKRILSVLSSAHNYWATEYDWMRNNLDYKLSLESLVADLLKNSNIPIKNALKRLRRCFNRSYHFAISYLGKELVDAFIRGEKINIYGVNFIWRLQLYAKKMVLKYTMSPPALIPPFYIYVYSKYNLPLLEVCVFFKNIPVLDQLVALALSVKSSSIQECNTLQTANIHNYFTGYFHHNLIQWFKPPKHKLRLNEAKCSWDETIKPNNIYLGDYYERDEDEIIEINEPIAPEIRETIDDWGSSTGSSVPNTEIREINLDEKLWIDREVEDMEYEIAKLLKSRVKELLFDKIGIANDLLEVIYTLKVPQVEEEKLDA